MGIGRTVGRLGGKLLGGLHQAQAMTTGALVGTGAGMANKAGNLAKNVLLTKTEKGFNNAYTGYKASKFTNVASTVGMVGVVGAVSAYSVGSNGFGGDNPITSGFSGIQTRGQKVGTVSYGGAPTIMSADGVGTSTQAPNLGASGDLVFGLHNGRKG